jgi:uncharacterized NAD(P)/FAD-binding protein YdhS
MPSTLKCALRRWPSRNAQVAVQKEKTDMPGETLGNGIERIRTVAIIGAGFSGTILAVNLLRHEGPHVLLVERRPEPGRGVAYSSLSDAHVLNVRASNMSAFHDDPSHFARWLQDRGLGSPSDFISRRTYGDYLAELFEESRNARPDRITLVEDRVTDLERTGDSFRIMTRSGQALRADAVVLAVGNLPPHELPGLESARIGPSLYAPDPWSTGIADDLEQDEDVLILGTGLTMVDAALFLDTAGFRGRIFALSRRGLLPRSHSDGGPPPERLPEKPGTLSSHLVRSLRRRSSGHGWRAAVDELRPYTQMIWRGATHAERSRFLRHLRPWWDVHRHRIAPQVAERLDQLRTEERLIPLAGAIVSAEQREKRVLVTWRPRGTSQCRMLSVRRIINCTGPQGDLLRTSEPLLRSLIDRGMIRPDAHRLGIDVDRQSEVVGADGGAQEGLYAVGPMTRGAFWEIVAVPDIRVQAWALARRLCDAHWVEGEGL